MDFEAKDRPCLDRNAQIEFGRFYRERLDARSEAETPFDIAALLDALRAAEQRNETRDR